MPREREIQWTETKRASERLTNKVLQCILEVTQHFHVEVVRWLVQEKHVGRLLEHLCKVHAIALTARALTHQLVLLFTLKVELYI